MENQNNEADLVNDLSEVLNELKEIEERSGDCDLLRTYAMYKGDFVCFQKCGGVMIQEAAKVAFKLTKFNAMSGWWPFMQRNAWSDPENLKCQNGWLAEKVTTKYDSSCDESVNGCFYD